MQPTQLKIMKNSDVKLRLHGPSMDTFFHSLRKRLRQISAGSLCRFIRTHFRRFAQAYSRIFSFYNQLFSLRPKTLSFAGILAGA